MNIFGSVQTVRPMTPATHLSVRCFEKKIVLSVKFKLVHVKLKRGQINMQSEYQDRKWLMHEMILGLNVY